MSSHGASRKETTVQHRLVFKDSVGPFVLKVYDDPTDGAPVLWRTVTCTDCGKLLAKGKMTDSTSADLGTLDAMRSLGHECQRM